MSKVIKRSEVLKQMETREKVNGKPNYFSIQFYKKNGELVILHRAKITGLRANMSTNRLRGIQAIDNMDNPIGHIYAVSIDNIRMFNEMQVAI